MSQANIGGQLDLGFAGLFSKAQPGGELVETLPFYRWTADITWTPTGSQALTYPTFHLTKGELCLGHLLTHLLKDVVQQVEKRIIDPLHPVRSSCLSVMEC